jgi:hypothetical protein
VVGKLLEVAAPPVYPGTQYLTKQLLADYVCCCCRMFLDSVVPSQLALRGDGSVCLFEGNFSEVILWVGSSTGDCMQQYM